MRTAKPQCFHLSGKNFTGNEQFQGNIYLKPEESAEYRWFCVVNNVMSPYDLYERLSSFSFLVSKFSNLTNIIINMTFIADTLKACVLNGQMSSMKDLSPPL